VLISENGVKMFSIDKVLKRAWHILWDYKVLWIFAFLLAFTGGSSGGASGRSGFSGNINQRVTSSSSHTYNSAWASQAFAWFERNFGRFFDTQAHAIQSIIWGIVIIVGICILIGLILALVRYPAETAIIRMVDDHEITGVKQNFKAGWKLGWNVRAFRIWLIDLLIGTPIMLVVFGLMAVIALGIFDMVKASGSGPVMAGLVGAIILAALLFIPFALLFALVGIIREFIIRFAAIEGTGVGESFSLGWRFFIKHIKPALLIWLILLGIGIAAGIALMVAAFLLIPTYVIMAIPGAIAAAIPGAIGFGITSLIAPQVWPWVIGALIAIPVFFAVTLAPLTFVSGWVNLFSSNVWTLTYRELKMMDVVPPVTAPSISGPAIPLPVPPQTESTPQ